MSFLASSGSRWSRKQVTEAGGAASWVRSQIPSRISRGWCPLTEVTATPAAMRRRKPATRTMKNSSMFEA